MQGRRKLQRAAGAQGRPQERGKATHHGARGMTAADVARPSCLAARQVPGSGGGVSAERSRASRALMLTAVHSARVKSRMEPCLAKVLPRVESEVKALSTRHAARQGTVRGQAGSIAPSAWLERVEFSRHRRAERGCVVKLLFLASSTGASGGNHPCSRLMQRAGWQQG